MLHIVHLISPVQYVHHLDDRETEPNLKDENLMQYLFHDGDIPQNLIGYMIVLANCL